MGEAEYLGRFLWYELMTGDVQGAEVFYPTVVGWGTEHFDLPNMKYI